MNTRLTFPISPATTPGILAPSAVRARSTRGIGSIRRSRFVMESHLAGAPVYSPRAILIAATIAVALYLIGRRLSDGPTR